ncbi:hypothetical protein BV900_14830 [Agrobacterium tumefaciens]|nr:hypothetical protein BV900_14830 [Agrobacterium tumefaciens]
MLLTIGYLTTPSHASGVSLSEFWAWVRYLHAIADGPDLRLTPAFFELDAHQKTILSDDFGMGAPIYWLLDKLQLGPIADGRYFIDRVAASVGATATKPKKRGPGKSPDFVACDARGIWHIIECKGTQTGNGYRERQMGALGPPATGAIAQKRTITFPTGYAGQRLACGLQIGVQGGAHGSSLRIIDPPAEKEFAVGEDEMVFADDAIIRAASAKSLRLAGFGASSSAMSAPSGITPQSRPLSGRYERLRREVVDEKKARAVDELKNRRDRAAFTADKRRFLGRTMDFDLPAPITVGKKIFRSVRVRYGVSVDFLGNLSNHPLVEDPIQEVDGNVRVVKERTTTDAGGKSARMHIGEAFVSEIDLRD